MNKLFLLSGLLCCSLLGRAQDSLMMRRLSDEVLNNGTCYENLHVLCKQIGNRLSGSVAAEKAVRWGFDALREAGADTVYLQPVWVPRWERGEEHLALRMSKSSDFKDVPLTSLGNSKGTNGKLVRADVVMFQDFEEYEKADKQGLKGKIVFFNYRFRQDFPNTFNAYSDAVKYRWETPVKLAGSGVAGIIIRSVSSGKDDFPHTGSTGYRGAGIDFPIVAVGNKTADKLAAACSSGFAQAMLRSECKMNDSVLSYNVIGEWRGTSKRNEYVVVGGHLDSWDVGEGAHDDGAGCVQAIEVLRTLKAKNMRLKRTLRAVLFMNEENGAKGGRAYADSAAQKAEKHVLALESDAGGFSPRGFELTWSAAQKKQFAKMKHLFVPYGVYDFEKEGGGVDVSFLKKNNAVIGELLPDSQRYFDLHHTDNDVFEQVNHRELKLGAAVMTQFIWLTDAHDIF